MLFWTFDFERKKGSRIFFWVFGLPKKIQIFKTYKKHHAGELHKKRYNFAPGAVNHTFLTHPVFPHILILASLISFQKILQMKSKKHIFFFHFYLRECKSLRYIFCFCKIIKEFSFCNKLWFLQSNVWDLRFFKICILISVLSNNLSLKY